MVLTSLILGRQRLVYFFQLLELTGCSHTQRGPVGSGGALPSLAHQVAADALPLDQVC